MANKYRGEISANFDGMEYTLCLTLGALAQLEDAFKADDMLCVAERFSTGRISAADCIKILGIGLRAAGHEVTDQMVENFRCEQGAAGYVQTVARLLEATFGTEPESGNMTQSIVDPSCEKKQGGKKNPPKKSQSKSV